MISLILKWLRSKPSQVVVSYHAEKAVFKRAGLAGIPMADEVLREITADGSRDRYSPEITLELLDALGQYGGEHHVEYVKRLIDLPARTEAQKRIRVAAIQILPSIEARAASARGRDVLLRPAPFDPDDPTPLLRPAKQEPQTDPKTLVRPAMPAESNTLVRPAEPPD